MGGELGNTIVVPAISQVRFALVVENPPNLVWNVTCTLRYAGLEKIVSNLHIESISETTLASHDEEQELTDSYVDR